MARRESLQAQPDEDQGEQDVERLTPAATQQQWQQTEAAAATPPVSKTSGSRQQHAERPKRTAAAVAAVATRHAATQSDSEDTTRETSPTDTPIQYKYNKTTAPTAATPAHKFNPCYLHSKLEASTHNKVGQTHQLGHTNLRSFCCCTAMTSCFCCCIALISTDRLPMLLHWSASNQQ
jgi:hypothetical protein